MQKVITKAVKKGFTLIELLVVIAIIGILAAIVLVSLGSARSKGADAGIQGNLDGIRTQAEIFASDNSYWYSTTGTTVLASGECPTTGATMFGADPTIKAAIESARKSNGGAVGAVTQCAIGANADSYAVAVKLKNLTGWWCVDSNGIAKNTGNAAIPGLGGGTFDALCP